MESTIIQNGALYAIQHVASDERAGQKHWLHADVVVRVDSLRPAASAVRKMKRENLCYT